MDLNECYRIVKYLIKTKDHSLVFIGNENQHVLKVFTDANWAEDQSNRKSTSGSLCQMFGSTISWSCRKQNVVAISTTESEYYALAEAIREVVWLKQLLADFNIPTKSEIPVMIDSQSCISMVTNEKFSNRTKYIDVRYHFVKDYVQKNVVKLKYVPTQENIADMLTKPLAGIKIKYLRNLASVLEPNVSNLEKSDVDSIS